VFSVMYRAAAALLWDDREQATAGLQGQLRVMATAGRAIPDWSTLVIDGPTEVCEPQGRTWVEWTGRVRVAGEDLPDLPPDDADLLPRSAAETMPAPATTLLGTPARCSA
jgi:hypothetical protein